MSWEGVHHIDSYHEFYTKLRIWEDFLSEIVTDENISDLKVGITRIPGSRRDPGYTLRVRSGNRVFLAWLPMEFLYRLGVGIDLRVDDSHRKDYWRRSLGWSCSPDYSSNYDFRMIYSPVVHGQVCLPFLKGIHVRRRWLRELLTSWYGEEASVVYRRASEVVI